MRHILIGYSFRNELLFQASCSMHGLLLFAHIALVLYLQFDLFCRSTWQGRKRWRGNPLRQLLHLGIAYFYQARRSKRYAIELCQGMFNALLLLYYLGIAGFVNEAKPVGVVTQTEIGAIWPQQQAILGT